MMSPQDLSLPDLQPGQALPSATEAVTWAPPQAGQASRELVQDARRAHLAAYDLRTLPCVLPGAPLFLLVPVLQDTRLADLGAPLALLASRSKQGAAIGAKQGDARPMMVPSGGEPQFAGVAFQTMAEHGWRAYALTVARNQVKPEHREKAGTAAARLAEPARAIIALAADRCSGGAHSGNECPIPRRRFAMSRGSRPSGLRWLCARERGW